MPETRRRTQNAVVRAGQPAQQIDDRQTDGDQHPVQHVEGEYGDRGHGEQQLAAAEREQPPEVLHVDQAERGKDDDRAERGRREPGQDGRATTRVISTEATVASEYS